MRRAALLSLAALALAGCGTGGLAPEEGANVADGKLLFTQRCGGCHTLREAGTRGSVNNPAGGPNLDEAFSASRSEDFPQDTILQVVHDQIKYAVPPMPRNLVKGNDADAVAAYVAEVAANPKAKVSLPAGAGGNDPKLLFQSNCGSCHTLADAGTSGTIGPNLDQVKPSLQRAVTQITNGGGGMPPFKGQLTPDQIRALAQYVVKSTQ
ncbi:MAG TPA: c-type cytochrome [Gaiellaceae bacterium]|nr:c-type cytochrome [Gaiellaceae bacterium]